MGLPDQISFERIATRNGSQPEAFEELCCQVARHWPDIPSGSEFIRYRGAGGDGGVECVWRLPNGDEWGLQAKYIFDFNKALADAAESFSTAIQIHKRLVKYFVYFPFETTGPTGRKGKNQRQIFEEKRAEWIAAAKTIGVEVQIFLETPSTILDALAAFDPQGGRLRYWFDATIFGDDWFAAHLEAAIRSAGPRYTPQLNVAMPIARDFEAFGATDRWFDSLLDEAREFKKLVADWEECVSTLTESGWSGAPFPEGLRAFGKQVLSELNDICTMFQQSSELKRANVDPQPLATRTKVAVENVRRIRVELAKDLDAKFGEGSSDSQHFRQFQAEYQCSFPASNVDKSDAIIGFLERLAKTVCSSTAFLPHSKFLTLVGAAGVGKTHSICDTASERRKQGLRTLVLHGGRFAGEIEAWEKIRQILGLDGNLGRDAMLAALDASAEASGKPLLIFIDGLNERLPRDYWTQHLLSMTADVARYEWLKLGVSCRSTYESQVLPETMPGIRIIHTGFAGAEFDACQEFFEHYGLEPPVVPTLQSEFSNPLFLQLVCKAMVAAQLKRLPIGWHGLSGAINALIGEKNKAFAKETGGLQNHRIPERGLMAFVGELERRRVTSLLLLEVDQVIEPALRNANLQGTLTDWLIREELLIVDAQPGPLNVYHDCVRIAFDRMGDHLLASKHLENIKASDLQRAFDPGGSLSEIFADSLSITSNAGFVEALAIQIPEKFSVELSDLLNGREEISQRLLEIVSETIPWRDPSRITFATRRVLQQALQLPGFSARAFDTALAVSVLPSEADAFWLHRELMRPNMSSRDDFWCGYLHQSFEERSGPVQKLLRVAFQVDPKRIPAEISERWAMTLIWFCAAADRRVRDHATKAMVRITEPYPCIWGELIPRLADIDDEYVVERALASAYGALLRSRNLRAELHVAKATFQLVFADPTAFQNALIRDYARSILELAMYDHVPPEGIEQNQFMPPYKSDWPLLIPDEEEVDRYKDSHHELPRLYRSCLHDDFNHYTLSRIDEYEEGLDKAEMGRWIFNEVLSLGYGSQLANYDGYMVYKYGGGRGRPEWAERIGKKYQLIALSRLAGYLSDHLTTKPDRWGPKPLRAPLSYTSGREIDPSILQPSSPRDKKATAWWVPNAYDFDCARSLSHSDWVNRHDDVPKPEGIVGELNAPDGSKWTLLQAYLNWSEVKDDEVDRGPYRLLWLNIQSYLVSSRQAQRFWDWLQKKNFMGRWMPDGREFHHGFFGEYPWATSFNEFEETFDTRSGEHKLPCRVIPTTNSLNVSSDSYQVEGMSFDLPARCFFEENALQWNGVSGYRTVDGRLRFLDPSAVEPGAGALLADPDFLRDFLDRKKYALVWTTLGEKLAINNNHSPRLTFNQVHMLKGGKLSVSTPYVLVD